MINIYGSFDGHSSYGLHTLAALRHFTSAKKFAYRVSDYIVNRPAEMLDFERRPDRCDTTPVLQISPPDVDVAGGRTAIWTMTESAGLHWPAVSNLNRAQVVIVPNNWCAEIFSAAGVRVPICVANLGIDQNVFNRHRRRTWSTDKVIFGWSGSLYGAGARKNVQTAIDGFMASTFDRPAELRIRCLPSSVNQPVFDSKRSDRTVVIRSEFLSPSDLASWYCGLDAYLSTSSGEAINLAAVEALACGTHLISPVHGGVATYATSDNTVPIQFELAIRKDLIKFYLGLMANITAANVASALDQFVEEFHGRDFPPLTGFTWADSMQAVTSHLNRYFSLAL